MRFPRGGELVASSAIKSPFVFAVSTVNEAVDTISSTAIRACIHSKDSKSLKSICPKEVFDFLTTGPGAILYRKRRVFISFSYLYYRLQKGEVIPDCVLQDSLFFFGSKRGWFWPEVEWHHKEQETSSYVAKLRAMPAIERLLIEKIKRNEVCFLKPDKPGMVGDFPMVSLWFQSLGYGPLILDRETWNELGKKDRKVKVDFIMNNIEEGSHDYPFILQLLEKSVGNDLDAEL